jgi:hypothetical protein
VVTCKGDDPGEGKGEGLSAFRIGSGRWRAGAAFGVAGTNLIFQNAPDVAIERRAATVAIECRVAAETTLTLGGGASLGGSMITEGGARFQILPGWLVSFTYARRLLEGRGAAPFLMIAISAAASGANTRESRPGSTDGGMLYAIDVRAGLVVGKTFWNVLSPYGALRGFGGPVFWDYRGATAVGTDQYHFQVGFGMVASLPRRFDLYVEGAPLGERAFTFGGGMRF